jgi:hypothetical protein
MDKLEDLQSCLQIASPLYWRDENSLDATLGGYDAATDQ